MVASCDRRSFGVRRNVKMARVCAHFPLHVRTLRQPSHGTFNLQGGTWKPHTMYVRRMCVRSSKADLEAETSAVESVAMDLALKVCASLNLV